MTRPEPTWRKASACESHACVEVADLGEQVVVRDSAGTVVKIDRSAWREFVTGLK